MSEDDSTVRLPGKPASKRSTTGKYDEPVTEPAFGGEYAAEPTTQYEPGNVTFQQPAYPEAEREDRTLLLGSGGWGPEPPPPPRPRDRLIVHLGWEILLVLLLVSGGIWLGSVQIGLFSGVDVRALEMNIAVIGALAIAMSLSLRAAVPNLAIGAFAVLSGALFVYWVADRGLTTALGLAVGVALLGGLALGVVVAIFHVPGWTASLVAVCGALVALGSINHGRAMTVPAGTHLPNVGGQAALWGSAVLAASIVLGFFGLMPPIRRAVGAFRPAGDPAVRSTPGAALMVAVAFTLSAGIAAGAGVLSAMNTKATETDALLPYTLLALGAALLGGVSAYGRRGGMLGTAVATVAICLALQVGVARGWPVTVTTYAVAGGAILLGLVVTRLVEWGGRAREQDVVQ